MVGPVVDLAFSHATDEVVLGAVDSYGNLFVYKVEEQGSGTVTERLVEIMHNAGSVSGKYRHLIGQFMSNVDLSLVNSIS